MEFALKSVSDNTTQSNQVMPRIIIPNNKAEKIKLAKAIVAKHKADGASSPLASINIADLEIKATTAAEKLELSDKLHRDAETATQECDSSLGKNYSTPGSVNFYLASVRDLLSGVHKSHEQKLGDWGFEVTQSNKAAAPKTPATKPAKQSPTET